MLHLDDGAYAHDAVAVPKGEPPKRRAIGEERKAYGLEAGENHHGAVPGGKLPRLLFQNLTLHGMVRQTKERSGEKKRKEKKRKEKK